LQITSIIKKFMSASNLFPTQLLAGSDSTHRLPSRLPFLQYATAVLLTNDPTSGEALAQSWKAHHCETRLWNPSLSVRVTEADVAELTEQWREFAGARWLIVLGDRTLLESAKLLWWKLGTQAETPSPSMIWIPTTLEALEALHPTVRWWDHEEARWQRTYQAARPISLVIDESRLTLPLNANDVSLGFSLLPTALATVLHQDAHTPASTLGAQTLRFLPRQLLLAANKPDQPAPIQQLMQQIAQFLVNTHSHDWLHTLADVSEDVLEQPAHFFRGLLLRSWLEQQAEQDNPRAGLVLEALQLLHLRPAAVGNSLVEHYPLEALLERTPLGRPRRFLEQFDVPQLRQVRKTKRQLTQRVLRNLENVDRWVQRQTLQAAVEQLQVTQRKLSYLAGLPLNFRSLGLPDPLPRQEVILQETAARLQQNGQVVPTLPQLTQVLTDVQQRDLEPLITDDPLE
jgi:hypothetical protein